MTDQSGRETRDIGPAAILRSPGRRMRGALRGCLYAGAGCFALALLALGVFFALLSHGPVSLTWLTPRIIRALDDHFGRAYDFRLAGASVSGSDQGPTLTIDGLVVRKDGHAIVAAPRAELALDWPMLLFGQVKPRRLEALDLDLRLSVQTDGSIAVSAGADTVAAAKVAPPPETEAAAAGAPSPPVGRVALLKTAAGALRQLMDLATSPDSPVGALDRLGLQHARLTIDDRTVDRTIIYKDVSLSLTKGEGAMRFSLAATGPSRRWSATAAARGAPGQTRAFAARVRGLSIDEISLIGGFRNSAFDTDAPLSVDLSFSLSPDDVVQDAKGGFEVGQGFFRLDEPDHEPVMIDRIAGQATWRRQERKLILDPVAFKAGGFDMAFIGEAAAPAETAPGSDPGADAWTIALRLQKPTEVAPERLRQKPVLIEQGGLDARLLYGQGRVLVDRLAFLGPDGRFAAAGALTFRGETRVIYSLDLEETQISAVARLWPTHVAAPVRAWFTDHVPSGVVKRGHLAGDFDGNALVAMRYDRPPPDAALSAEADILDASVVEALAGAAPLTGVSGKLRITGRTASFRAVSGALETAPGRRLSLTSGLFSVSDNALRPTPALLDLAITGSVEAAADILSLPAIATHASIPIDAANLRGQIEGRLKIDFEIGDKARDDHITFAIDATTTNLVIEKLIGKERLEGAALHILADRNGLKVNGTGRIFNAPATLDVRRGFGEKGPAQAQLTFSFDEAARQRAGYGVAGVSGPVSAIVRTPLPVEDLNTHIELDLTRTAFENPVPGLVKAAGKPAKASFLIIRRGEGMALEQFNFDAGPAQAQGVIDLSKEGAFRAARLAPVRLSPGDDMRLDISRSGEALKVVARGSNFDARPMLGLLIRSGGERSAGGGGVAKSAGDDVDVELRSPIITGHGKQILSNANLSYQARGGRPKTLALTGSFGREQLAIAMTRGPNGGEQIDIVTDDAGSFLAFMDLYRKMESGVLNANVALGQNRADGSLRIRDFYVKGEPTMRQLMAQGGVSRADDRGVMRFDPDLVRIGRLQTDFTWTSGHLAVREGVMSGPEIGLTFDGFIDFPRDRLDLSGSYVPAYALNSLLSQIPVLGVVITGGQHEGIFALNYRVTGAISSPIVNVNPLSAIAPGLMRKIMGVLDGTARIPGR